VRSLPDTLGIAKAGRRCKAPDNRPLAWASRSGSTAVTALYRQASERGVILRAGVVGKRAYPRIWQSRALVNEAGTVSDPPVYSSLSRSVLTTFASN